MVKSMYSGISGLRAHQSKMDVIGNNIANVNTYGFKSGRVTFKESIYQTSSSSSSGNDIYGGSNASQIGYGSQVGTIDLLMANGSYAPTDSSTDCMIDGQGFFLVGAKGDAIALENGTSDLLSGFNLTRVGNFQFDGDGYLVDGSGNVVYGYRGTTVDGSWVGNTSELQPIRIPDAGGGYEETPVTLNSIRIDATGEVIGTNTDGAIVTVGMIALSNVPNPAALEKTQGPYYKIQANTGIITANKPGFGTTGTILNYGLEMSNVDLAREFSDMITTQRGFQANTKIITVTDEMLQELVNLKR